MAKLLLISFNIVVVSTMLSAQVSVTKKDSLSNIEYNTGIHPVDLYIIDGLKLSRKFYDSIGLDLVRLRHVKVKGVSPPEAVKMFGSLGSNGVIFFYTKYIFIVNGRVLNKKEKESRLLKIDESNVFEFRFIQKSDLFKIHNLKSRHGGVIINHK